MPHRSSPAPTRVSADLQVEVRAFYAGRLPLLEDREIEEFAATTGAIPYVGNKVFRHWFDEFVIEQVSEDEISVVFRSLVSVTDEYGRVVLEPGATVEDVLVRRDGRLFTQSRVVRRHVPAPDGGTAA
ncbi:hypothetical protein [Streptomyces sp. SD15]